MKNNNDLLLEELKSLKRGIYYLISKTSSEKGSAKKYNDFRKKGFKDEELSIMFDVSESGIRSAIASNKKKTE